MSEVNNEALEDLKQIDATRPELTAEEWEVVGKATEYMKSVLRPEVRKELDLEYVKRELEFRETMSAETKRLVAESMDKWRKEQEPLTLEDIGQLLSQEYVEKPVELQEARGERNKRYFVIRELPQEVELKFIAAAQQFLIPMAEDIAAAEWKLSGSLFSQIVTILEKIPRAAQAAAEIVAICLNPWKEMNDITAEWVAKNVSCTRMAYIIAAQSEANRYRDFFLNGFQVSRTMNRQRI